MSDQRLVFAGLLGGPHPDRVERGGQCSEDLGFCVALCTLWPYRDRNVSIPLGTRRCYDVESTSLTLIQRRNNVVSPVGYQKHHTVPAPWQTSHRQYNSKTRCWSNQESTQGLCARGSFIPGIPDPERGIPKPRDPGTQNSRLGIHGTDDLAMGDNCGQVGTPRQAPGSSTPLINLYPGNDDTHAKR